MAEASGSLVASTEEAEARLSQNGVSLDSNGVSVGSNGTTGSIASSTASSKESDQG